MIVFKILGYIYIYILIEYYFNNDTIKRLPFMISLCRGGGYTILAIKYIMILNHQERSKLLKLVSKGTESARRILHANILLAMDESSGKKLSEKEIAEQFHINLQSVHTIQKRYTMSSLEFALGRKKRETPPVLTKIIGDVEARIIA